MEKLSSRIHYGNLSSVVGIICNLLLFVSKLTVGLIFGVLSIVADGFNNLSDLGSNFVALIGFRVASRPADREHPFGHARAEYIAAMIVAFIIFFLGAELIITSVKKIITPEESVFSFVAVGVLLFSIAVKLFMFIFNTKLGKKIGSPVLKATAMDSLSDVIATSAVLVALIIGKVTAINLDAYMAICVAVFIIITGVKIIKETFSQLLGEAPTREYEKMIRDTIMSYDGVLGIHDLMVHNYGPDRVFASVHVEVDATKPILESHDMIDLIEKDMSDRLHLVVHLDPIVVGDPIVNEMHLKALEIVNSIEPRATIHDFRMVIGTTHTNFIFDVVMPFECTLSDEEVKKSVDEKFKKLDPNYYTVLTIDKG